MEQEIFKNTNINLNKLKKYGFKKEKKYYIYETNILNNEFKVIITINKNITGKIIDLETNEEYLGLRTNMNGTFVNKLREEYKKILNDIKEKCTNQKYFDSKQANRITNYIIEKYNDKPEFLWDNTPQDCIFRNKENKKWYAIIMNINRIKLDEIKEDIEIINLKIKEEKINELLNQKGFYKAYHMNKKNWITIILNDTLKDKEIINLIKESYQNING